MAIDKFKTILSTAVPLPIENVDTDQIIPARFLKATTREGFGENLFRDWRYGKDGEPKKDFVLNLYGGKKSYKVGINGKQKSQLSENLCIEACLKFDLSGKATLTWFDVLDPEMCGIEPEKTCDDLEAVMHIKKVMMSPWILIRGKFR